jgi:hypothetical protein
VTSAPKLEDYLEGGSKPGVAVTEFRQREPKDLEPATESTTAYLSYDAANLYRRLSATYRIARSCARGWRSASRFSRTTSSAYVVLLAIPWMGVGVFWSHGTRPNYFPAAGASPFLASFDDLTLSLTFRPTSSLLFDETFIRSRLDTRDDSPGAGRIFTNPILRSRVNYQFSREWSLRAIVDYSALDPNPSLVALDRTRHAGGDVLLTWLLHPGTALYIGYTDGYDNQRLDPVDGVVATRRQLSSTGRQVFVKTSWLFRF